MELSRATLEHLRDEAYLCLCREAVQARLRALQREKNEIARSRPPFGMLAARKSRDVFENSLRAAEESETSLRMRLTRIERFETWLHRCIGRELTPYLEAVNVECQRVAQIRTLLDEWEASTARFLPDTLVAFAREMRGVRQTVAGPGRTEPVMRAEIALLHDLALRVEQQQDYLGQIATAVNTHALEFGLIDVRCPPLPSFRRSIWVDRLTAIPLAEAVGELTRAEGELRNFLTPGMQAFVGRLQASRVACAQRQENYLQQYWDQLRAHAQTHWVEEREVDEVLAAIAVRYDADIAHRQREVSHNPFATER